MHILYYYIQLIIYKLMRYTSLGLRPYPPISTFLELTQPCRCKRLSLYIYIYIYIYIYMFIYIYVYVIKIRVF